MSDTRPVAVVTGASRGAGAGIATALGAAGYTVYVTGRTLEEGSAPLPGTVAATAQAVTNAGGLGVSCIVDHRDDDAVKRLFERVRADAGRLDVLVNNVAYIDDSLIDPGPFWEKPISQAEILTVGLRSSYIASYFAAPLMIETGAGLIAFTSSFGSACYMHGAAYGAQKVGQDKLAADMAVDLRDHDVAAISVWMGPLATARTAQAVARHPEQYADFMAIAETPEFTGRLIAALHAGPDRMSLSGQTLIGAEKAAAYGLTESDGRIPPSYRAMLGEPRTPHPAIVR